jgi:putative sterol carrier protein/GNAT superfamily N-acetyltransferase
MYSYRNLRDQDEQALTELLKTGFPLFLQDDYWNWKYKKNPDFNPSLIVVAEKDGKLVGCNHWLQRDLKLSGQLKVRTALACDLLVHPEHRGHGIAAELLWALRSSEVVKNNGITLSYMFAPLKLNKRLYAPVAGYVAAPNSTSTYKKFFNCRELKERIKLIDYRIKTNKDLLMKLQGLKMNVLFRLSGIPAFTLQINSDGIHFAETEGETPDIVIEGTLPLSSAIIDGRIGVGNIVKAWMTGKLKVRKGMLKIFKLRGTFEVLRNAAR